MTAPVCAADGCGNRCDPKGGGRYRRWCHRHKGGHLDEPPAELPRRRCDVAGCDTPAERYVKAGRWYQRRHCWKHRHAPAAEPPQLEAA